MIALLLSSMLAQAAPTQPLFVPIHDVDAAALVERSPDGVDGQAPLAWSAIGAYAVGAAYPLRDGEGAIVLECMLRSFELRPAPEDAVDAELWATLDCPVGRTAGL